MPKETIFISSVQKELDIFQLKYPHSSYPFNPALANCMFLTGAIERFGTGIPEMYALSAERGLRMPDFEDNKTFMVTIWRPSASSAHDTDHDTDYDTDHDKSYIFIEELPKRLLWVLEGEKSRNELMEILQLKHNPTFRDNYIEPAMKNGWIEMTIPDKPKSKKQRYRLTKAGLEEKQKIAHDNK